MESRAAQREIHSILKTLNEAEQSSGLPHDDPSLVALEVIMLAKVAALEEAKLKADQVLDASAVEPTEEQATDPEPQIFFAPTEEEQSR